MPHFSKCCGRDEYICQVCTKIFCSKCNPSEWRPDVTGHKSAGNVCGECLSKVTKCKCGEPVYDHGLCYQCLADIDEKNSIEKRREMLEIRAEGDR